MNQAVRRFMADDIFCFRYCCQRPAVLFWCIQIPTLSKMAAAKRDENPSVSSRLAPLMPIK
ncbi:hypothetical protein D3C87_1328280 [compost metagenome]